MPPYSRLAAVIAATFIIITASGGAGAQESPAPAASAAPIRPERSVSTHHTIAVGGGQIAYTATAGTLLVRDANEAPIGSFFYVAYTKDGENHNTRPLTFLYNGGPGSSTMWLHMGSLGPKHVLTPDGEITGPAPYQLVDNPDTLLDRSDLVFIDAMGTGYSRIVGKGTPKMFYGIDEDGAAFTKFVRRYITQNDRWNSPKFLFGESYGTTRSAVLAADLDDAGISLSGVTLLSTVLDFNTLSPSLGEDIAYVGFLPTQAAVAWYHNKIPNKPASLAAFVASAKQFAAGEYAQALLRGDTLGESERRSIAAKLSGFIGIDQTYILNADLRVSPDRFEKELLRSEHRTIGRLDGRFEGYDVDSAGETPEYDPTNSVITDAFTGAFNRYVRDDLKYVADIDYLPTSYAVVNAGWNFKRSGADWSAPSVVDDLRRAMTRNPHLRVFSANGYFDLATPFFATDYTLEHLGIPPAIAAHISYGYYESGHMVYLHPQALAALHHDLEGFYDTALTR
jgi:carboxypeptidase C (cathepsin A)